MSQLGAVTGRHAFDIDSLTAHLERHLPEFRGPVEVQQFQGDAGLAPLDVQVGAIGDASVVGGRRRRPVHAGLEDLVGQALDLGPVESRCPGPQHRGADGDRIAGLAQPSRN